MNIQSKEEMKRVIEYHKGQIKRLEEALSFEDSYEVLLRGRIEEEGVLKNTTLSPKIGFDRMMKSKSTYEMQVSRQGREITCIIVSTMDARVKGIGKATCKPGDKFDYTVGVRLSEIRARQDLYSRVAKKISDEI